MQLSKLPQQLKSIPDWTQVDTAELDSAWRAAIDLVGSMQSLNQQGRQVVGQIIGDAVFTEWQHYPENDVRDDKNASQYFYHAHPGLQRPFTEHGHFHLFVHAEKLGMRPSTSRYAPAPAHVVAVSMDAQGLPSGFFVVNRWVTKGPWLSLAHCKRALQHFKLGSGRGNKASKDINTFLRALLQLYYPRIIALLEQRDKIMASLCKNRDRRSVFADTDIEVLCYCHIDLMTDIAELEELHASFA
ncbi:DUF6969 family protein [Undibacterium sp. Di27W]|uniref:DUF6969 family protein n=1 Tax=Undibacterium sp. Di27W TaxID=3413036 RepID=UPI003BF2CE2A